VGNFHQGRNLWKIAEAKVWSFLVNLRTYCLCVVGSAVEEHHALAEVGKRVPEGTICLLSGCDFHNLTTQIAHEIWVALDRKARYPKVDFPRFELCGFRV
jgi:hypothetical protein